MILTLIPPPPAVPAARWLAAFAHALTATRPALPPATAIRFALLAHPGTWLLEPDEAVTLWVAAIDAACRDARERGRATASSPGSGSLPASSQ